ncbi:MAG TPA: prolyl oligopeptidase family serine peptidase [Bryobacteraceae bacterium]|nr:prolyl oligopeptidase family serine peptidase [Bryobacteraceae bacterium]
MKYTKLAVFSAVFCAVVFGADQHTFTLEQVLSAPFPSGQTVSTTDGNVAWVLNEAGARNIWVAQAPDYKGRRLTAYRDDDGQEIAELQWTPDGKSIVFVRGGDFEFIGRENPNPRSFPQGVEQDIWMVSTSGGPPRKLAEGHSPAMSPKDGRIVYLKNGQVWIVDLAEGKPEQLIHARGRAAGLRWSPDGSALAFESERGDHSFIGVYQFAEKTLTYLDPSVDRDGSPVWSPDGKRIAFMRIAATSRAFSFGPVREAEPWSIRMADAATAVGRQVWKAEPGMGSAYHGIDSDDQIFWGDGDHLAFAWERDGWLHLYSVTTEGGAATLLTPGDFEVENVSLSADHKHLVFSSNQNDIDRRHLWRVAIGGGNPEAITQGNGIEWSPGETADGHALVFFESDARRPARAGIKIGNAAPHDLAPDSVPADFPVNALNAPEPVILSASDGMRIHGQLFLPPNDSAARHPALIFFHGGSRRQMLLGWHYMGYYNNAYGMNQYLASRGYVVLSVNYRSGIGYGMKFREALNYGATGASEFNDVMGAGLYLRGRNDVDPKRIGLWGGSYGGYLTALGLARASDLFAAGVDFHGVHEWNIVIHNFAPGYNPATQQEAARIAFESSPMASVGTWKSPVLLIHGDDDRNVPFSQTVEMVEALRKQHVDFEELIFPDEIHGFLTHRRWLQAYHAAADFFGRKLGQ